MLCVIRNMVLFMFCIVHYLFGSGSVGVVPNMVISHLIIAERFVGRVVYLCLCV